MTGTLDRERRVALLAERLAVARREEETAAEDERRAGEAYEAVRGTPDDERMRQAAFRARRLALSATVRVRRLGLELREAELDLRVVQLGSTEDGPISPATAD